MWISEPICIGMALVDTIFKAFNACGAICTTAIGTETALKDRKEDEGKIREGVSYDKKDQRVPDRTGCQRG